MDFANGLDHQCAMDVDCLGITCDVQPKAAASFSKVPNIPVSFRLNSCTKEIILMLDNKKWARSLSSIITGTYTLQVK